MMEEPGDNQLSDQVLVEVTSMADLMVPLQRSSRIKYNCISVSSKLIAIGSNTGGIYLFNKKDCKQIQIVFAEKETSPASKVLISPNEKFVAVVASSGILHVIDLKLDSRAKPDTIRSTPMIGGTQVTAILWDQTSTRLYIGDNLGKVSMVPVHSNKAKNLFSLPIEVIMKLDSYIVQLDKAEDKLLVSTLTRCYLCDTNKQTYSQIGKKLRDGHFGTCFLMSNMAAPMVYSARPGSRIWEVGNDGNVLNTHQFKWLLAIPSQPVLKPDGQFRAPDMKVKHPEQAVSFPVLNILGDNLLLSWTDSAIYILDPVHVKVILWCQHFSGIVDIICVKREIFVFLQTMQIYCITIMPAFQLIPLCMKANNLEMAANLCLFYNYTFHRRWVRKRFGVPELRKIFDELVAHQMVEISEKIHALIVELESRVTVESGSESSDSSRSRTSSYLVASTEMQDQVKTHNAKDNVVKESESALIVKMNSEMSSTSAVKESSGEMPLSGLDETDGNFQEKSSQQQKQNGFIGEGIGIVEGADFATEVEITHKSAVHDALQRIDCNADVTKETNTVFLNSSPTGIVDNDVKQDAFDSIPEVNPVHTTSSHNSDVQSQVDIQPKSFSIDTNKEGIASLISKDISVTNCETSVTLVEDKTVEKCPKTHEECMENVVDNSVIATNLATSLLGVQPPSRSKSVSPLPHYMRMSDGQAVAIADDEEEGTFSSFKGSGSRRSSLTSLSSLSSAEVLLDQPSGRDFRIDNSAYDPSEQIAIPVKKKHSTRKSRRKKSGEELKASAAKEGRSTRSQSLGALFEGRSKKEHYASSSLTMQRAISEDCSTDIYAHSPIPDISVGTQSGSAPLQEVDEAGDQPAEKALETLISPLATSPEFSQSGEFGRSDEFSPAESPLTQSWDGGGPEKMSGPSSAPKTALLQLREKVQTKVASRTKKIIKNIKDKNLLTRAKEFAENLSQVHDNQMAYPGEMVITDSLATGNKDSSLEKTSNRAAAPDEVIQDEDFVASSLIDIRKLQDKTADTKEKLEDIEVIMDPDAIQPILLEWITVLNQTFHQIHVKKFMKSTATVEIEDFHTHGKKDEDSKDFEPGDTDIATDNQEDSKVVEIKDMSKLPIDRQTKVCESGADIIAEDLGVSILNDKNFCYSKDPLCLSKPLLRDVSELTQACFDIGCHGNILLYQRLDVPSDKISAISENLAHNKDDITSAILRVDNSDQVSIELDICSSESSMLCHDSAKTGSHVRADENVSTNVAETSISNAQHQVNNLQARDQDGKEKCYDDSGIKVGPDTVNVSVEFVKDVDHKTTNKTPSNASTDLRGLKEDSSKHSHAHNESSYPGSVEVLDSDGEDDMIGGGMSHDVALGFYVRCYFPYLSAVRVKEWIQEQHDYYHTWCALVCCLQISAEVDGDRYGVENKSIISHLLDSHTHSLPGANGTALLGHVSKLFIQSSVNIASVCVKCYPHISPLDILYMCRFHSISMDTVFAEYMLKLMEEGSRTYRDLLSDLCQHCEVRTVWLEALLKGGPELGTLLEADKQPRLMSHMHTWPNAVLIDKILCISTELSDVSSVMFLCHKYGYWRGVLKLLKGQGHTETLLQMILQLGDIDLLSAHHDLGYLPSSVTEWERLLAQYKEVNQSSTASSDWPATITWDSLANILVKTTGPETALVVLEKCGVPNSMLSPLFYHTCMLSGFVHKHQKLVLQSMLEKVDTYLWSQRPTVFSPQLHYLLVKERALSGESTKLEEQRGLTGEATGQQEQVQYLANRLRDDQESHLYVEDPECHWGVETKFNLLCPCCSVSLREPISHVDPGVLLFKCGHGYHKLCIPLRECVLCDPTEVDKAAEDGQFLL